MAATTVRPTAAVPEGVGAGARKEASALASGRPFFIFGSGRSGTSLLSRMLNHHPNLAVPAESHLYTTFYPWLKHYGDLAVTRNRANLVADILATVALQDWSPRLGQDEVLARIDGDGFGAVVDAVMSSWTAKEGKRRWGEKTPKHAFYWRQITADFPRSQVIHIVRDGRDCALSHIKARFGPKSIYACAREWRAYLDEIEVMKAALAQGQVHEISYEALLADTEGVLRDVCAFLGEAYVPEMLHFYRNAVPYPTDPRNRENLSKPLLAENKEKWRGQMTAGELRVFEAVAGAELTRFGYARTQAEPVMSRQEQRYRHFVEAPWRRSIGRLKDRKGQRERLTQLRLLARRVALRPFVG